MSKGYLSSFLRREAEVPAAVEVEITSDEIKPEGLMGASVIAARTAYEASIGRLDARRALIADEIERLNGELANTDRVLHSQRVALGALDLTGMSDITRAPAMPAAATLA